MDAFNATLRDPAIVPRRGPVVARKGWFDDNYLGIDQGPIAMIENYRTQVVRSAMKKSPYIVRGLRRVGLIGGWIDGRC